MFICPLCGEALIKKEKSFCCSRGHCFDCAKSGYVHLLPVQQMHAKNPGDNKLMVEARRQFLDKGYYGPLARAFSEMAGKFCSERGLKVPKVVDAGCGEGYYTACLYEKLCALAMEPEMLGIDISKIALDKAAKRAKMVQFAVGSVFHLPVATESADLITSLFAPYCGGEYRRVLKTGGLMLLVIPGENHLWELKEALYDRPYKNEVKPYDLEGFTLLEKQAVQNRIHLTDAGDIANLFRMTPYYYKTGAQDQARLLALDALAVQTDFQMLLYERD